MENKLPKKKYSQELLFNKTQPKEFMVKKINIEKYPKIKKSLNSFFNDVNKYFETSYDDKYLIIGNTHTGKKTILFSGKNRNKKINRRISISKANLKLSNDSQNKSIIIQKSLSRFLNEEKKRKYTSADGNSLKPGQRFIEDKEIENIFNLYKELRNINKNKKNNFATLKELNESKNIFDSYFSKKSKNFNSIINLKKHKNKEIYKSSNNKEKDKNFLIIKDFHNEINKNINHKSDIENYKTYSTFSTFKDELSYKNNFMSFDIDDSNNNIINKLKINSSNEIKEKQKLLNKQKQYISQKTDVTIKNRFAQVLALQEKVFLNKNKNRNNQLQLKNYLSSKIKRTKNKLLLVQEQNYRKDYELKLKLNILHDKLNPDQTYDWFKDLHSSKKDLKSQEHLTTIETIRDPKIMKIFTPLKKRFLEKNEYMKKVIPKKQLKNFSNDLKNINKNYDSLLVRGVDLLKLENDIFKRLKGRKIINEFERLMSPSNIKCKDFCFNINRNLFNQNTKPAYNLID